MVAEKKIAIIGEVNDGGLTASTRELLGGGRGLADVLGGAVEIVVLAENAGDAAADAIEYGADVVRVFHGPHLRHYLADLWLPVLVPWLEESQPGLVLIGQTAAGRDLGPRLAHRLHTGIVMDCVRIDADADSQALRLTRPVFGGKAMAVMVCRSSPTMATVRAKAMKAREPDPSRKGEIIESKVQINPDDLKVRLIERTTEPSEGVPLEDAAVVVSGGRGMGGTEGFARLEELARLFKGAVGASRPPCDNGWVATSRQVGLTGKIIRPDLYFAVALSGSSQHMAGCQNAGTIIAINQDPEANIFSYAHFGLVDDYKKVLPHLIARLKEKLR